ncbi:MAG: threonylcarbamoyl-AMP synthase [Alphaproteobacteria bacterium]|nr:threonylcarbamoyl-AMP synthase [Alphaproteobacteria bacterium]
MINATPARPAQITAAADAIRQGQLVAFGTETVYGLGGDATNPDAVARIYAAKGRPAFNPLISHIETTSRAFDFGLPTLIGQQLADAFWPGPMTLILNRIMAPNHGPAVCDLATAGLDSIALRVPAKAQARQFLAECGCPVAAPSANRSGRISPTRATHVMEELGGARELAMILDMGPAEDGVESTVIDARGEVPLVLRPGSITPNMIEMATGFAPQAPGQGIISPGQMESHYAPSKPVALNITTPQASDVMIGFGPINGDVNLSPAADLVEAAANLYHMMRQADMMAGKRIAIAPVPEDGLGIAINDRLRRAAADRPLDHTSEHSNEYPSG